MHKLTIKRQVTIPKEVCEAVNICSGDYVEIFVRNDVVHVVKMDSARHNEYQITRKKEAQNP